VVKECLCVLGYGYLIQLKIELKCSKLLTKPNSGCDHLCVTYRRTNKGARAVKCNMFRPKYKKISGEIRVPNRG